MASYYQNRDMSEIERRRRAAARAKRKKRILRNRIIFISVCLLILLALGFGIYGIVQLFSKDETTPEETSQSQSQAESVPETSSAVPQEAAPLEEPQPETPAQPAAMTPEGDWLLTLVNNNVPLPEGWQINTVVAEDSNQKELADVAAAAYREMKAAAALEQVELLLCSGYRSVEYQQDLFDQQKQKWLDKGKNEQEAYDMAKTVVALPGYSEHNSGLAADIVTPKHQNLDADFANTQAGKWLAQHAPEYGFILRYPENKQSITGIVYEPWHFRYVGVENAQKITQSGKCLEEYLDENL